MKECLKLMRMRCNGILSVNCCFSGGSQLLFIILRALFFYIQLNLSFRPPLLSNPLLSETTVLIQHPSLDQPNRTCIKRPLAVRDFYYFSEYRLYCLFTVCQQFREQIMLILRNSTDLNRLTKTIPQPAKV